MAKRLVGVVQAKEVQEQPLDFVSIGLSAFGHRAEIGHVVELVLPIIDVIQLQLPELVPLVKNLLAAVWPGMARDIASSGVVLVSIPVEDIQRVVGVKQDGVYGSGTEAAVKRWQMAHDLLPDGWAGRRTILAMGELLNEGS